MFDFSKITGSLSSLAGGDPASDAAQPGSTLQDLGAAGLDPGMLEGLAPQEIVGLLSEHGIDPSQFSPDQIGELTQSMGVPQSLTEFGSSFLRGDRS
jgi:hypothetical protein